MYDKILLIGPRFNNNNKSLGGIVVLFEDLVDFCLNKKIQHIVIDTNKSNYKNVFIAYFKIICLIVSNRKNTKHILLNGTAKDYLYIVPILVFISNLYNTPVSLRKFAGNFYSVYTKSNFICRKLYEYGLFHSTNNFFETKYLVEKFKFLNKNTFWWPNSRPSNNFNVSNAFKSRFVFISQIKQTKGIYEFLNSSNTFNSNYTFDVYGPVMDNKFISKLKTYKNANYKGLLNPKDVCKTLAKYNVLVLPTYHDGEGYPGIILEAFSIGMPVISTRWNSIPEIIKDKHNGLLISIKNEKQLVRAINYFDNKNYSKMSKSASTIFKQFDSNYVNSNFFKRIN